MPKTNIIEKSADVLLRAAQDTALGMMAIAATFSVLELPDRQPVKVVLPSQPNLAPVTANVENSELNDNALRREREEETGPHFISYSVSQRTPGRAGKA